MDKDVEDHELCVLTKLIKTINYAYGYKIQTIFMRITARKRGNVNASSVNKFIQQIAIYLTTTYIHTCIYI